MQYQLEHGDCLEVLRTLADSSVDAIVTDPPYGLSFMGKRWDYDVPGVEVWTECLRVLKPGGHLLAFAGTRTQHRMAVRIEDAGFEIRDMIAWVYGSGFPKSLDVSKAIDKAAGANPVVVSEGNAIKRMIPGADQNATGSWIKDNGREYVPTVTMAATDAAAQWHGWGTALKPALEPITVARKPLAGTVVANVLAHGTGGLNIDGCRVGMSAEDAAYIGERIVGFNATKSIGGNGAYSGGETMDRAASYDATKGRWPANLIHDGSKEVLAGFPQSTSGAMKSSTQRAAQDEPGSVCYGTLGGAVSSVDVPASSGSAARFFYCAKASRADRNAGLASGSNPAVGTGATMREREDADWPARNGNHHPTVKPTDLMAYLCRLVTPPGGLVLDPFMGSGSTGKACMREGFRFLGIEHEAEYLAIARARIEHETRRHGALAAEPLPPDTIAAAPASPARHAQRPEPEPAQRGLF